MQKQTLGIVANTAEPARKSAGEIVEKLLRRRSKKRRKIVTMEDGRESAKHEPWTLSTNDRVNLEKSLQAISLLLYTLTDPFGEDKDLDSRVAVGFAIALDQLAYRSQALFSREERVAE
jgi:hypothetical protein